MAYHEQGSYIIRVRAVAHNEYNIVLKAFKYYYTKLCHKAWNKPESYVLYRSRNQINVWFGLCSTVLFRYVMIMWITIIL